MRTSQISMQLVVSHDLKHLSQVLKMDLDSAEVALGSTLDEYVIVVAWSEVSKRSQHLIHHAIESGQCVFQPL